MLYILLLINEKINKNIKTLFSFIKLLVMKIYNSILNLSKIFTIIYLVT